MNKKKVTRKSKGLTMGLAASQARLLTITARLADNELRSQTINNAKMRLATQSSQASENYVNALNQANLMFTNYDSTGAEQSQLLTFNALTGYSQYNNQYGLANAAGLLLVSENDAAAFQNANGDLNAFLKNKGLEYNTTYFKELCGENGSYVNNLYPAPFNKIRVTELQEMYEAYGSYEHSVEMETYEKLYEGYTSYATQLEGMASKVMNMYLSQGLEQPYNLNITNYDDFKNKMITGNNNYSLNNLKNKGYITDTAYNNINDFYNAVGNVSKSGIPGSPNYQKAGISYTQSGIISYVYDDSDENKPTYKLFDEVIITGNKEGNSWTISYDESKAPGGKVMNDAGEEDYHYAFTGTTFTSVKAAIEALTVQAGESNGDMESKSSFKCSTDETGELVITETTVDIVRGDKIPEFFNDMFSSVLDEISSSDSININKFLEEMNKSTLLTETTIPTKDELNKLMADYKASGDMFISFIDANFTTKNTSKLKELIDTNKIVPTDLCDLDFLMKLLGGSVYSSTDGKTPLMNSTDVTMTSEFKTVVSDFIIKNMISETGEPKYAWIDENDTGNTGNADAKAQWYTNLFNRMKQGYKTLENGLAASAEWMQYALESGIVTVEQVNKTYNWKSIDYKTCAKITEQTDNSAAVAKAEAEYSRAMNDIKAKDNMYDIELKNIDTEHTALQTEYESIKTVINKNVERVFKFCQNG